MTTNVHRATDTSSMNEAVSTALGEADRRLTEVLEPLAEISARDTSALRPHRHLTASLRMSAIIDVLTRELSNHEESGTWAYDAGVSVPQHVPDEWIADVRRTVSREDPSFSYPWPVWDDEPER
jgi:hypothetical protein